MNQSLAIAAIALWDTKMFSTADIARMLNLAEADIERCIHIRREAARGIA